MRPSLSRDKRENTAARDEHWNHLRRSVHYHSLPIWKERQTALQEIQTQPPLRGDPLNLRKFPFNLLTGEGVGLEEPVIDTINNNPNANQSQGILIMTTADDMVHSRPGES